jgi:hypothetical protein
MNIKGEDNLTRIEIEYLMIDCLKLSPVLAN